MRWVKVFARTSPDQKEFILTWLKNAGACAVLIFFLPSLSEFGWLTQWNRLAVLWCVCVVP